MDQHSPPGNPEQMARALTAGLAFVLLIAGELTLYTTRDRPVPGLLLTIAAVALFVGISARRPPRWTVALVKRIRLSGQGLLIGFAICLILIAAGLDIVFEQVDRINYLPVLVLWAGGIAAYIAAFLIGRRYPWREWLKANRREIFIVAGVTAAAAAIRFYQLGQIPRVINGDEGLIGLFALTTDDKNPLANPFALFENFGGLYMQAIGLSLQLFGHTPFALRLMPAIGGTLAIPAVYLLGRQIGGRRVALFSAILLAVAHGHIHFSRTVAVAYIQETLLISLALYFFLSGLERRSALRMALAGAVLSLSFSVYVSAQIIAVMLVIYIVVAALIARPAIRGAWRCLAVFWFSALLIALPQIAFNLRHLDEFLVRLNSDGTFQSGWLANEVVVTGRSAAQILFERVAHAFLSLNHYPAFDFYGARIPMLDVLTGILFFLGLGYSLWRTRDHRSLLLNGYFWSLTVAIGVFAVPPSADSYRMLATLPAAIIMAAIGLDWLLTVFALEADRPAFASVATFVLIAIGLLNIRAYYFDFALHCRYGEGLGTRFASYLGNYLRSVDRESTVYLLSNDELYYGTHLSVDFLSNNLPVTNVPGPVAEIQPAAGTTVIAIGARADELRDWTRDHPGGRLHQEYDCENLMLLAYQLP